MRSFVPTVFCIAIALGACKGGDGYAVDITATLDSSVSDADIARLSLLDLTVDGDEAFSATSIPIAGKFQNRSAGIRYKPALAAGQLSFTLRLRDAAGELIASGALPNVSVHAGSTQHVQITLQSTGSGPGDDMGISGDMTSCGNGIVDPGETCDPGTGSATPCPRTAADCDDKNSCTTDALTGTDCSAQCTHMPIPASSACLGGASGATSGVCVANACCVGCVKGGTCVAGDTDPMACGGGGNSCFDCTQNSATATCNGGTCSGCDATSCTTDGRTCGTSSCGYNCGGCPDSCANGAITHYACVSKSCQQNGGGNCGAYATCKSSTECKSDTNGGCSGDADCTPQYWCSASKCIPRGGVGASCSAEGAGDHECLAPNVCSWAHDAKSGYCVPQHCTGCWAVRPNGTASDCLGYIDFGLDPRAACQGYTATTCHQNYCAGTRAFHSYDDPNQYPAVCDFGKDRRANWRACGAVSCTTTAGGTGTVTGYLCQPNYVCTNMQGPYMLFEQCNDPVSGCYSCTSSGCDLTRPTDCT